MEFKSYGPNDSEGHNADQLFIGYYQEHQALNQALNIYIYIYI